MINTQAIMIINKYENEILELIDNQNEYTRGDLQSRISAIILSILSDSGVKL